MKRLLIALICVLSVLALVSPVVATTKPMGKPWQTTPKDLPVLRLPAEFLAKGHSSPMGNPHGTPPGQNKPKPPPEPTANKWAVVIGIADYQGRGNDLWHPDEDAKDMKKALVNNYGFDDGNIKLLVNRKATARAILDAIDWLVKNEDAESTVVFFFSGHGYRAPDDDYNNDGILDEGWDADEELDKHDEVIVTHDMYGLPDGLLKQKLSALESQKVALIFGSCYSGGMFDDDDDLQAPNRVICSACKADQYAWDYLLLGNTLFGYYFVDEGILQGLADANGDEMVSMEEALAYAYPLVTAEQPVSQPQIDDGFAGELIP